MLKELETIPQQSEQREAPEFAFADKHTLIQARDDVP